MEQQAKVIKMRVEAFTQMAQNVQDYYDSINSLLDKFKQNDAAERELMMRQSRNLTVVQYSGETSTQPQERAIDYYKGEIGNLAQQEANLITEINEIRRIFGEGVLNGTIVEGSEEYRKLQSQLADLEGQLISTKNT